MNDTALFQFLFLSALLIVNCMPSTEVYCSFLCQVPAVYDPVCGANGRTYSNECVARCEYVPLRCRGSCPCGGCVCTFDYNPVCGVDGETYSNPCFARCSEVYFFRPGEC